MRRPSSRPLQSYSLTPLPIQNSEEPSTPERKFDDVWSRGVLEGVLIAAGHDPEEILACEAPVEGLGDGLVVLLEAEDALGDHLERVEVGRGQSFALEDGEVELDLV